MMKGKKLAAKVLLGILLAAPYGAAANLTIYENTTSDDMAGCYTINEQYSYNKNYSLK